MSKWLIATARRLCQLNSCSLKSNNCVAQVDRRPYATIQSISAPNITSMGSQLASLVTWKIYVLGSTIWKKVPIMGKLSRVAVVTCVGIVVLGVGPQIANASCTSKPNIFGGSDTRCTDGTKTSTKPNIFGGYDTYDGSGRKVSSSKPNIFGGTDTQKSNNSGTTKTRPNIFGGNDISGSNGSKVGSTRPNIFGGYDVLDKNGRKVQSCKPNIFGGYDCR